MMAASVLVVEDNTITRKMFRLALTAAGYDVRAAENGRAALAEVDRQVPDLILLDLHLPDINGVEVACRVRASPSGAAVPIIAVSGFQSQMEQAQSGQAAFTDYLFKPVEPSRLVDRVASLLAPPATRQRVGNGQLVLAVDDDPVELKLLGIRLGTLGFRVVTASDGEAAMKMLQRVSPQVVVSDVLMPRMDGFRFCQAIRRNPDYAHLPVVLHSNAYVDEADRALARAAGVSVYLVGSIDLEGLATAIVDALAQPVPAVTAPTPELPIDTYLERAIQQAGRQAQLNRALIQRAAFLESELAIVASLTTMLAGDETLDASVKGTLWRALTTAGLWRGAVYLTSPDGRLSLNAQIGHSDEDLQWLADDCAGCAPFFLAATTGAEPAVLQASADDPRASDALARWRARSILLAPLVAATERLGLFVMVSSDRIIEPEVAQFARICANHAAQAIGLSRAREERRRSDQRYRTLAESAEDAIFIIDRDSRCEYVNAAGAMALGMPGSAVGKGMGDLFGQDTASVIEAKLAEVRATHRSARFEGRLTVHGGQRWFDTRLAPIPDLSGEFESVMAVSRDITERKTLEAQFQQSQKLEAIGQLAGGIAHDFNNLLTAIIGYGELLLEAIPEDDARREDMEEIQKAGQRAAALTRQLLAFSRRQILEPKVVDLNVVLADLERMLGRVIGEDVQMRMFLGSSLRPVMADAGQIEQVIVNLAVNARDAMPTGGSLTIETANVELDQEYADAHPGVAPGGYVTLAVSDTGTGMTEDVRERVFDPFFTTKEKGRGSGLGLSTVYGIVKQSGGTIGVYSEPGKGSVFRVYLPSCDAPIPGPPPAKVAAEPPQRGTETILLVEDDEGVRTLARRILLSAGYVVLDAASGEDAVSLAQSVDGAIDLVVTDVVMPGMSGPALMEALVRVRPDLRAVYTSGYTDTAIVHHGILNPGTTFLQKPYTVDKLTRKVREVLDTRQRGV